MHLFIFYIFDPNKGSYRCGGCRSGYIGNQSLGCLSIENLKPTPWMCPDGTTCHQNGECVRSTTGKYACEVSTTINDFRYIFYNNGICGIYSCIYSSALWVGRETVESAGWTRIWIDGRTSISRVTTRDVKR